MYKQNMSTQYRRSNKVSVRYLQQVDRKVRHVVWTSFHNKLCLEGLYMNEKDIFTGLYRVDVPNM